MPGTTKMSPSEMEHMREVDFIARSYDDALSHKKNDAVGAFNKAFSEFMPTVQMRFSAIGAEEIKRGLDALDKASLAKLYSAAMEIDEKFQIYHVTETKNLPQGVSDMYR